MRLFWLGVLCAGLIGCTDRSQSPTTPMAMNIGSNQTIFAATSREATTGGQFGFERADHLSLLELTVSIPPTHTPGDLEFGYGDPDPNTEFVIAARHEFDSERAFKSKIRRALGKLPANEREVTIFVHGYNATQAETAFRAAQIAEDIEQPGVMVIYSWPSQGNALGYVYDNDSMLFARDGLESLIHTLHDTGTRRTLIVAHSLGSALTMETLRQIDLRQPGQAARLVAGVVLISPDLDVEVFRGQLNSLAVVPQPFVVFVSKKDTALNISSRLRGRGRVRLGNISNINEVSDLPIEIVDTTAFSSTAGSSHLVAVTSPALIAIMNKANLMNRTFKSEDRSIDRFLSGNIINGSRATELVLLPNDLGPN